MFTDKDLNEMKVIQEPNNILYLFSTLRLRNNFKIGDFRFSVQAGPGYYSSPGANVPLEEYTEFEVALLYKENFLNPRNLLHFQNKSWVDFFEDAEDPVAGYVPRKIVVQILNDVKEVSETQYNTPISKEN